MVTQQQSETPAPSPSFVKELPDAVVTELDMPADSHPAAFQAGGEDGRTLFDTPSSDDRTVLVVFPRIDSRNGARRRWPTSTAPMARLTSPW